MKIWIKINHFEQLLSIQKGDELFRDDSKFETQEIIEALEPSESYIVDGSEFYKLSIRKKGVPSQMNTIPFMLILQQKNWFIKCNEKSGKTL